MVGTLLLRGMLVGFIAGLLAFGFAKFVGEPQVDRAIAFEARMDAAKGEAPEPELVSRGVQSSWGLLTGAVVYGTAAGGSSRWFSLMRPVASARSGRADWRRCWRLPPSSPSPSSPASNTRPIRLRSAIRRRSAIEPSCSSQ